MPALNKKNLVGRKDYGVKVARPYYDVRNCADNQLLFNSGWPILQIVGVYKCEVVKTVGTIPTGWIYIRTSHYDYDYCASNSEMVITSMDIDEYKPSIVSDEFVNVTVYIGYRHNLGYPPLAFPSRKLSSLQNHVVITNIDISKDVDYPYTDAPLEYFGGDLDYGVKSRAYWMKEMPKGNGIIGYGINSRLSSKMVQSVKTDETIDTSGGNQYINWEPPKDASGNFLNTLADFEFYGFGTADGSDVYYPLPVNYYPLGGTAESAEYVNVNYYNSAASFSQASLVVLRSPMVSPKIVEVTYNGS